MPNDPETKDPLPYTYDRSEHRHKHCSRKAKAHFQDSGNAKVGKCPSTLDDAAAQKLLETGVPYYKHAKSTHPDYIYAVHEGVIYEAMGDGKTYHGYPWMERPDGRPPKSVMEALRVQAGEAHCAKEFRTWLKAHGNKWR